MYSTTFLSRSLSKHVLHPYLLSKCGFIPSLCPKTLSISKFTISYQCSTVSNSRQDVYKELVEVEDENSYRELVDRYFHVPTMEQQVIVVQPYIKHGQGVKKDTNRQLMLEESIALVRTLDWKVVDHTSIGLAGFNKKFLFGSGILSELQERVVSNQKITAVFISLYQLTVHQRLELERVFMVPVIDRYHLVLQIFFQHAQSREAKLQVALAEIPYLKNRLLVEHEEERGNKHSGGNLGEKYFDTKKFVLKRLEAGIKKKIEQLKGQREKLRKQRKQLDVATVAVIGYTNCGKTSLIKSITGNEKLRPKNQLFATLDVTCHGIKLPESNMEVVFIDTVGFISDIPTALIASFRSTLEDALQADLLLHVVDFSNPDWLHQTAQVVATLKKLNLNLEDIDRMITVGNKIDKLPSETWTEVKEKGALPISATAGYGVHYLLQRIEDRLLRDTDRQKVVMKVRPGGEEWEWLHKHSSVGRVEVWDQDPNYNLMNLVITKVQMEKFKALFVKNIIKEERTT